MTDLLQQSDTREAKERANRIRVGMVSYLTTLTDIRAAWDRRDWQTLGYADWDAYLDGEFSETRLRIPVEHRQKAIAELRMAGMSTRAIASAVNLSQPTVAREVKQLSQMNQLEQPERVKSLDGKDRPATQPPRKRAVPEPSVPTPAPEFDPHEDDPDPWALPDVEIEQAEDAALVVRPESAAATVEGDHEGVWRPELPAPVAPEGDTPALPWPVVEDRPPRIEADTAHAARVSNDVRRLITLAQTFGSPELRAQAVALYADSLGNAPMPPSGVVSAQELRTAGEAILALAKDWKRKR